MKKYILLFLVTVFISQTYSQAQQVKGFGVAGVNLSQINGDEVFGFKKWGFNGGVGAFIPFAEKGTWNHFQFSMELLFSQKGAAQHYVTDLYPNYYDALLNYVEVPLLLQYTDAGQYFTAGLGVSYGRLVKVSNDDFRYDPSLPNTLVRIENPDFNKNDLCFVADVRFKIWRQLKLGIRYSFSLLPVKEDVEYGRYRNVPSENTIALEGGGYANDIYYRNCYNQTITARFYWIFNEKEPVKKKGTANR